MDENRDYGMLHTEFCMPCVIQKTTKWLEVWAQMPILKY